MRREARGGREKFLNPPALFGGFSSSGGGRKKRGENWEGEAKACREGGKKESLT